MEIDEKSFKEAQIKDGLKELISDVHETAKEHGWWDKPQNFSTIVSLVHSELSEALEFERNKDTLKEKRIDHLYHFTGSVVNEEALEDFEGTDIIVSTTPVMSNMKSDICRKPDGVLPELADAVIRIFDYVGHLDMSKEFIEIILEKHNFNKTRPHRHGGKKF